MKQYVIDEIRPQDYEKVKAYLDETLGDTGVDGVYWVPMDEDLLSEVQKAHDACAPFYMALELEPDRLCGELLVRPRNRLRCDCIHYADRAQRDWLIRFVDAIFDRLDLIT